ncbi:hypothetical protein [Nocardioides kribbensis]|uniref:hypothetical protein n=1 Tax=Nocardioides kribbensis TaxID=305517 RepID=UPI001879991F|nr:hypothetical protein [Nocardioides kribbensis]
MSALFDSRPIVTAVKAALTVTLGADRVFEYGDVPGADNNPGSLPRIFALPSIERRFNPALRFSAETDVVAWRLSVRVVGSTVDEARWALFKVAAALNEQSLPVAETFTTPMQFESDQAPESDDGRYSAVATYTFAT